MSKVIKIKYGQISDFRHYPVTGVFGGMIHPDLITMTFVADRPILPTTEEVPVDEAGNPIGQPIYTRNSEESILREAQTSISINLDSARIILKWLQEKIDIAESLHEK